MQLVHEFTVPVPADEAFSALQDVERVALCMPGATLDRVDGDEMSGRVKIRVGPMQFTYKGAARLTDVDTKERRVSVVAQGREVRGSGSADASVTAHVRDVDGSAHVAVVTELQITGRPAQFGRGVISEVSDQLIGSFAQRLAAQLTGRTPEAEAPPAESHTVSERSRHGGLEDTRPDGDELDMLGLVAGPVLKRLGPVVGVLMLVALAWKLGRRSR